MTDFIFKTFMDTYDSVARFYLNTGEIEFFKDEVHKFPLNERISNSQYMTTYKENEKIHPDDMYKFNVYLSPATIKKTIQSGYDGPLFAYRTLANDSYFWTSITLFYPKDTQLESVLLCRKKIKQQSADIMASFEPFSRKILKVVKCNLTDGSFRTICRREAEEHIRRKYFSKETKLHEEWLIESGLIHKDDVNRFEHYTNHQYITDYFQAGNEELSFFYRRRIGNFFKWVRLTITKAPEYSKDMRIFTYIIVDIDNILNNLLTGNGQNFGDANDSIEKTEINQTEIYNENLNQVLSYMTHIYIDFYMIDLKQDLYIMYKLNPEILNGEIACVGCYSSTFKDILNDISNKNQRDELMQYSRPSTFRKLLRDKTSIEYIYTTSKGQQVRAICTKIESCNNTPTKVICATLPYTQPEQLRVKTFGNFDVFDANDNRIIFKHKQAKELLAYLIDKQGYPVTTRDIVTEVLEKESDDKTATKYVSTLVSYAKKELADAGFSDIIIKEWNSLRINPDKLDCDLYHLLAGDTAYYQYYHNEYMKEYSWAEDTNSELLNDVAEKYKY